MPSPDPHAESYYNVSPYAYCANNPMRYVDPTGMDWYSYEEEYEDTDGSMRTRTAYVWVEGMLPDAEVEEKGYTHLGKTYLTNDTYYSLGGAEVKYDATESFDIMGIAQMMLADKSVAATVNSMSSMGDFWKKYGDLIGMGGSTSTMVGNFMEASKNFKNINTKFGRIFVLANLSRDVSLSLEGNLHGIKLADAVVNIISLAGTPGAAISSAYTTSKYGAKGMMRIERESQKYFYQKIMGLYKPF